jgi:hypothetical protein
MATQTRISDEDLRTAKCPIYHGGTHRLAVDTGRRYAECQGCGSSYGAADVHRLAGSARAARVADRVPGRAVEVGRAASVGEETTMTTKAWTVSDDGSGTVRLSILVDCALGDAGTTRTFWVQSSGGYVYETTRRPGTSGEQVSDRLYHTGSMISATRETLATVVRRAARACLAAARREEARW